MSADVDALVLRPETSEAAELARWDADAALGLSPGQVAAKQAAEYDRGSRAWRDRMGIKERVREKPEKGTAAAGPRLEERSII